MLAWYAAASSVLRALVAPEVYKERYKKRDYSTLNYKTVYGNKKMRKDKHLRRHPKDLKNADKIRPGMELIVCPEIPPRERLEDVYEVEPGDYLGKVAELHGLTIKELLRFQLEELATNLHLLIVGFVLEFVELADASSDVRAPRPRPAVAAQGRHRGRHDE